MLIFKHFPLIYRNENSRHYDTIANTKTTNNRRQNMKHPTNEYKMYLHQVRTLFADLASAALGTDAEVVSVCVPALTLVQTWVPYRALVDI